MFDETIRCVLEPILFMFFVEFGLQQSVIRQDGATDQRRC